MAGFLYAEIDIFCILLCLVVAIRLFRDVSQDENQHLIERVIVCTLLLIASDFVWAVAGGALPQSAAYAVNIFYFINAGAMSWAWFLYSERQHGWHITEKKTVMLLSSLPLLCLAGIALLTPHFHWIFEITADGAYRRGPLFFLHMLCAMGYAGFTGIRSFWRASRAETYEEKKLNRALMTFAMLPVCGGILEWIFPGTPTMIVCTTLALIEFYIELQNHRVLTDALTSINNRNSLFRYLGQRIRTSADRLHLLMIDADDFKQINDRYGHTSGDAALICVADALRRALGDTNAFLARYGGDEFVVVFLADFSRTAEDYQKDIRRELEKLNRERGTAYALSVSIGCARWDKDMKQPQDLIDAADAALYREKRSKGHE